MSPPKKPDDLSLLGDLNSKISSMCEVQKEMKTDIFNLSQRVETEYSSLNFQMSKFREDSATRVGDQRVAIERLNQLEEEKTEIWDKVNSISIQLNEAVQKLSSILGAIGSKEEWSKLKDKSAKGNIAFNILAIIGGSFAASLVGWIVYFLVSGNLMSSHQRSSPAPDPTIELREGTPSAK